MNNCCAVNYEDDRDYDYLIERLNHIEEEIQFIKKILEHKRIKEEAWEQLKQEAEYERAKDKIILFTAFTSMSESEKVAKNIFGFFEVGNSSKMSLPSAKWGEQ